MSKQRPNNIKQVEISGAEEEPAERAAGLDTAPTAEEDAAAATEKDTPAGDDPNATAPAGGAPDSDEAEAEDVEGQEMSSPPAAPSQPEDDSAEYWEEDEETIPEEPPAHIRLLVWLGTGLLLIAVVAGAFWVYHRLAAREGPPAAYGHSEGQGASASTPTHFQPLLGRWVRSDGGHVLEIRSIGPDGQMDASYYDPDSIYLSKAEAYREGSDLKVFVELRDMDYPGCTYTLTYNRQGDRLDGVYFQAMIHGYIDARFDRERK
ncbi:MAG: hypothetical protein AB1714_09230 [Acidobacteriota bacterium]